MQFKKEQPHGIKQIFVTVATVIYSYFAVNQFNQFAINMETARLASCGLENVWAI